MPHSHSQIEEILATFADKFDQSDGRIDEYIKDVQDWFRTALLQATQTAREETLAEVKKVCDKMKAEIKTPDGYASTYYNIKSSCDYNKLLDEIALALLSTIEK